MVKKLYPCSWSSVLNSFSLQAKQADSFRPIFKQIKTLEFKPVYLRTDSNWPTSHFDRTNSGMVLAWGGVGSHCLKNVFRMFVFWVQNHWKASKYQVWITSKKDKRRRCTSLKIWHISWPYMHHKRLYVECEQSFYSSPVKTHGHTRPSALSTCFKTLIIRRVKTKLHTESDQVHNA